MNVGASADRLEGLTRELRIQWEHTKEFWKDAKSREFERKYMDELLSNVNATVTSIGELNRILSRTRSDCE